MGWRPATPYESRPSSRPLRPLHWAGVVLVPCRVWLTVAAFGGCWVVATAYRWLPGRGPTRDRLFRRFAGWSSRLVLRIVGFRLEGAGDAADVDGSTVVVANHVAAYDGFALMAALGAVSFVARASFCHVPCVGGILRALGVVGIDRRQRAAARDALRVAFRRRDRPWPVAAFPEGATTNGYGLIDFKTGAFAGDIVKPVALSYCCESGFDLSYTTNQMTASAVLAHFLRTLLEPRKTIRILLLPALTRLPDEDDLAFARRTRAVLAAAAHLHLWDGWDNARLRRAWYDDLAATID